VTHKKNTADPVKSAILQSFRVDMNSPAPLFELRLAAFPKCWTKCGNCAGDGSFVAEIVAQPGDMLKFNDTVIRTETSKVTTDVPTLRAGRVVAVHVAVGDEVREDTLIATLELPRPATPAVSEASISL
jgi:Biotin-requiring enzyme